MTDNTISPQTQAFVKEVFVDRFRQQQASTISQLSDNVKDAFNHLPAYDQRTYSATVKNLTETLQQIRSASEPKRKFAFRRSTPKVDLTSPSNEASSKSSSIQANDVSNIGLAPIPNKKQLEDGTLTSQNSSNAAPTNTSTTVTVDSLSAAHYILDAAALKSDTSASLTKIHHSVVDLSIAAALAQPLATLAIVSVAGSLLLCGKVSGAVHVTSVLDSTLVISSRQVRMHECKNCVVYLQCPSRPIIEDCEALRFAPLPDILGSEVSASPNLWDQVDDFKWLKAGPSPHWSILGSHDERSIDEDGWERIIASRKSELDLHDLLNAAKIT
ncbi:tubulin-specific chaperone C, partial [Lecanoromycetidae sp. Uapishka_2]